ncbi:MAG TPA: alpha-glucuronidase family glycosyl hydrolase, partial [Polyangiaceae bacterium]|nr:alpha-glucuronidase family glycosyl hydrolase [Polyangiaceae bacterium]
AALAAGCGAGARDGRGPQPAGAAQEPRGGADDDGYRLWLRYEPVRDPRRLAEYRALATEVVLGDPTPGASAAARELARGLSGLLATPVAIRREVTQPGAICLRRDDGLASFGPEGFAIRATRAGDKPCTVVAAPRDAGVLYGAFHLLRHLQTGRGRDTLAVRSAPRLPYRMLDHWDNLDRTVERGYAGFSIWDWHKLPGYVSPQYEDYARASASVGINGSVLTNVNADALVLTAPYIEKVAAIADVLRPYGVRVYLTARFSAPVEIGGLPTADPLDRGVRRFWADKADEIYRRVPDFGGFLVKASAEGQPGPQDYGRSHAEGANALAEALRPHGGVVVWRAFVYANRDGADRAMQAYEEMSPLDGRFADNVLLQVKNGPIDFQPREPFHPLFGAMRATPLVAEFQITQEYLGFATHLAYLGTLFQETLDSDTHAAGAGSTVARALAGELHGTRPGGMAGVANIGTDRNWCGHPFAQANWYAFGRLAWDPSLRADAIADEWLRMTFDGDERFVADARGIMLGSREAVVDYMTPLGLHHIMAWDHHYGPGPWVSSPGPDGRPRRADWTSVYYHRADPQGIGFERGPAGSRAVDQYAPPVRDRFADVDACPEELLLWFHHVPWDRRMRSGRTLWDELCHRYSAGVAFVERAGAIWASLAPSVDAGRHAHVAALLRVQAGEARWWRDACILYFQGFSRRPVPAGYDPPRGTLDGYMKLEHHFVPGVSSCGAVLHAAPPLRSTVEKP